MSVPGSTLGPGPAASRAERTVRARMTVTRPDPLRRALRIVRVVFRHRLDELLERAGLRRDRLPLPLRLLWMLYPRWLLPRPQEPAARRLRRALEDLGPVFVKFGQLLSTRRDLLPQDLADELQHLQDAVTPFAGHEARAIVEGALGAPLDTVFASFDDEPIASASVAQVHGAVLRDPPAPLEPADGGVPPRRGPRGVEVVVKVIRPGIEPVIADDVALLRALAGLLERYSETGRRLHPVQIVDDYDHTIHDELDLRREAENTARLKRNFTGSPLLYVPEVHQRFCSRDVLVEERVFGIPIWDVPAIRAAGTDMKRLAEVGVETFFTQVFEDNFFHADMHPGNIFVDVSDPAQPNYIAIDCAICGSLAPRDQDYLARNLVAFFRRDYGEVARLHVESGWIPPDTDPAAFERVIREVCEPIFQKPLREISFGTFLVELFRTAQSFDMEVQPQLVLLQKTLLNIEGLGRQLYPDLDLWQTAQPFMERWMAERIGPLAAVRELQALLARLPELPALVGEMPRRVRSLEALGRRQAELTGEVARELARQRRARRTDRWLGAACAVGALALLGTALPGSDGPALGAATAGAGAAALVAGLLLWLRS